MAKTSDWTIDLDQAVDRRKSALDQEKLRKISPVIYKVVPSLRELNQEHFDYGIISLGLFDLFKEKSMKRSDISTRTGDALKLDVVIWFLIDIGEMKESSENWKKDWEVSWGRISKAVVGDTHNMHNMKMHYDGYWDHPNLIEPEIQSALALDAIFLASFLEYEFYQWPELERETDKIFCKAGLSNRTVLFHDIFKSENQIPLSLIKAVIDIRSHYYQASANPSVKRDYYSKPRDILNMICRKIVSLSPGGFPSFQTLQRSTDFQECRHLLHYQADVIRRSAEASIQLTMPIVNARFPHSSNQLRNKKLPAAKELRQYGIKFEGQESFFPRLERHPYFWWKATLFLPYIKRLDRWTEGLWRNLLAFEDTYYSSTDYVSGSFGLYIELMDQLIDDKEDVLVLFTGTNPVITGNALGDTDAVAKLFNSVAHDHHLPRYDGAWATVNANIISFHNSSTRRMMAKFMGIYAAEPWLIVSLVAATILLLFTFIQTIYTMKS